MRTEICGEKDPVPMTARIEMVVHPPLINVRISCDDEGNVIALGQIHTQRGPITLTATCNKELLEDLLEAAQKVKLAKLGHPTASSGAFTDWAKSTADKIAKAKVITSLAKQAKAVAKNPAVAKAVGLSTVVVPGTSRAVLALQNASEMLAGLKRKDPKVTTAWRALLLQAKAGNEKAKRSVHVVYAVAKAPRLIQKH